VAPEALAGAEVSAWSTWVLPTAGVARPPAPPNENSPQTAAELDEIVRLQNARTAATDAAIRRWDGDPGAPWSRLAIDRLDFYWPLLPDVRLATPARAARIMALLHVAMYDAIVASWDAKFTYMRRAPASSNQRVRGLAALDGTPSYPSEHAAVAAAAAIILAYAFPYDDSASFGAMAREAGESRIVGGVAYRSDVDAGSALGRAVAQRVLAHAKTDGSDQVWSGTVPAGTAMWKPTPPKRVQSPFDPLAGKWRTWVIGAVDSFRPGPPPALGSAEFTANLDELRRLAAGGRDSTQIALARYWATDAPSGRWELFLEDELARRHWSAPHAARARAYTSVAMTDAFIACWDTKYTYWLLRPISADPSLNTVYSTPPFPSYPSGHSTISTAASVVMGELFPDVARTYAEKAEEASLSRVWGGVHYRFDIVTGDSIGARVGRAIVQRMRSDGAFRAR
jgi:membrane-associated phospholipid phosphatase